MSNLLKLLINNVMAPSLMCIPQPYGSALTLISNPRLSISCTHLVTMTGTCTFILCM